MSSTILATMDAAGRLVIPKEIREQAQLQAGAPLQITFRDGHVEIEPAPREVRLVRKGRFTVMVPVEEGGPTLTADVVRETLEAIRDRKL